MGRTINLCNRGDCCPKLIVERINKKLVFTIVGDDGSQVVLDSEIARNLALAIFKEVGTST